MSTSLFFAIGVWTIVSNNDAAISEHKAKAPAAAALVAQAPALLKEADHVMAQARAAGHIIPEQPAYGRKIGAIADQAGKDFGLGAHHRPLTACASIAGNLQGYYNALFDGNQRFIAQWRRSYGDSVKACREAIRTPPPAEVTIVGPNNAEPRADCAQIFADNANQSKWVCPKGAKL